MLIVTSLYLGGRTEGCVPTHPSVPVNYIVEFYTNFNSGEYSFMFGSCVKLDRVSHTYPEA